jgi:hypothetical protein
MDEQKVFVDLQPLSDEQIKENNFGLSDLWMVKIKGKDPYGPYDTKSLKDYSDRYEFLFTEAKVYNLESDAWFDMFSISHFQRRKPQLVSAQNLIKSQEFYILYNGQKDGPHSQEKIQALLEQGHILTSTQVSLDQGQSWIKLYEHHAFDRRTKKSNTELPFRPNEDILKKIQNKKAQIIKLKEAEDAIVEFAFMGNNNVDEESGIKIELESIKSHSSNYHVTDQDIAALKKLKKANRNSSHKKKSSYLGWQIGGAFAFILVAVFGYTNYQSTKQNLNKKTAEVKTQKTGIDNSARQEIKKPLRKPASLQATKTPVVKPIRKAKPPRRIQRRAPKRYVRQAPVREVFEKDIENINIDDPQVQEELTRQLAGDYDTEDDYDKDEPDDKYEKELENPYDNEEKDEGYPEDNERAEDYPEEDRVEHENY